MQSSVTQFPKRSFRSFALVLLGCLLNSVGCAPSTRYQGSTNPASIEVKQVDRRQDELKQAKSLLEKAANSAENVDTLALSQEALDMLVRNQGAPEDLEVAYSMVGLSQLRADHFDEAVANLKKAVELAPSGRKSPMVGPLGFAKSWQKSPTEARRLKAGDRCVIEAINKFEVSKFDSALLLCSEAADHYMVASEKFELAYSRMLRSQVLRCAIKRYQEPDYYRDDYIELVTREEKYHDMADNMPELYTAFQAIPKVDQRECVELIRRANTMLFP